jgi:hypothetical protein
MILVGLLAACGGGAPAASTAAPPDEPGATTGDGTTPPPEVADLVACDLLGGDEIAEIVEGAAIGSMIDDAQDTIHPNHCRWTLEDSSGGMLGQIDLGIRSSGGRALYDESFAILGWEDLAGLPADAAIRDPNGGGIVAVSGDVFVDVFTAFLSDEQEVAITEAVLEKVAGR